MCKVDRLFAQAFLDEAASKFFNGNPNTAHLSLRDLVNSITGFEKISTLTVKPRKNLHRILSFNGNPDVYKLGRQFSVGARKVASLSVCALQNELKLLTSQTSVC